ncbi:MAG TPA: hypothetical protein PKX40_00235 [Spirochaetota bacterium]|nr:hypothetical protein [Spirochaetota bacterium]
MAVITLLLLLCISFIIHIYCLVAYVRSRDERYLRRFIDTTVTNVILAGCCIVIAIFRPRAINEVDSSVLIWLMSGTMMAAMVLLQASVFSRVRRRARHPEYYHYNHFGKKVLNASAVKPYEVLFFFLSVPFLLVAGAYFVARSIKYFY